MRLNTQLHAEAVKRGLLDERAAMDEATAFYLVRDMPYIRASSREPATIIREWRGTCSGKHYLLKAIYAEMGIPSRLIACTSVTEIAPERLDPLLRPIMERGNGRFVDVHNYLILELPEGDMVVDATWPVSVKDTGLVVNEVFIPGQDQRLACTPVQSWVVPDDQDPQEFKDYLLTAHFSPEELAVRDDFVLALGQMFTQKKE